MYVIRKIALHHTQVFAIWLVRVDLVLKSWNCTGGNKRKRRIERSKTRVLDRNAAVFLVLHSVARMGYLRWCLRHPDGKEDASDR